MLEKHSYYDYLRYELFTVLIPRMLYMGTEEENSQFLQLLFQENKELVRDMYRTLCEDDGVPYPYHDTDFETEIFERGGIQILQILLPPGSPEICDIIRAYLMYTKKKNGGLIIKYFVIRRFNDGGVFILNITPGMEEMLGEELTEHIGDMEYEYWRLVRAFAWIMISDMRRRNNGKGKKCKTGFNVRDNRGDISKGSKFGNDIGEEISSEQLEAFFQRLQKKEFED